MPSPFIYIGIGLLVALWIGLFALVLPRVMTWGVRRSAPYRLAGTAARASKTAVAILGEPLRFGDAGGTVTGAPPFGFAQLAIAVDGTKASGVIYVTGRSRLLRWKLSRCELSVPGKSPIDLRGQDSGHAQQGDA
jgi:hypothetical protein